MVWPGWYSATIVEFVVLENLASMVHMVFALLLAYMSISCARRVFWAYAFYQLVTTAAKTAAFPEHTLADWTWDFAGDTLEFLIGMGLAVALGFENHGARKLGSLSIDKACTLRRVLTGLAALFIIWLAAFINALTG